MIELRWINDPFGEKVRTLQYRQYDSEHPIRTEWTDVPNVWPEQHVKDDTLSSSTAVIPSKEI